MSLEKTERPARVFTNWDAELKAAEETESFSIAAVRRAYNWSTCAVGKEPAPRDAHLIELGYAFYDDVRTNHVAKAKQDREAIMKEKFRLARRKEQAPPAPPQAQAKVKISKSV